MLSKTVHICPHSGYCDLSKCNSRYGNIIARVVGRYHDKGSRLI